jgi:hypothetical protein
MLILIVTPHCHYFSTPHCCVLLLFLNVSILLNLTSQCYCSLIIMSQPWPWVRAQSKGLQRCEPRVSPGITFYVHGSARKCEGLNPHTPKWAPILRVGVPMDFRILRRQFQGSKLIGLKSSLYHWNVPYIIEKLLKRRCLKWACMTHLGTYNTSYGQKKKSQPLKVENRLDFLVCKWLATYDWNVFDEGYNFASDLILIGSLHIKSWESKITIVPILGISRLPFASPRTKWWVLVPMAKHKIYYTREGSGFPQIWAMVSLVSSCLHVAHLCTKSASTTH